MTRNLGDKQIDRHLTVLGNVQISGALSLVPWAANTSYPANSLFVYNGGWYLRPVAGTSAATFVADEPNLVLLGGGASSSSPYKGMLADESARLALADEPGQQAFQIDTGKMWMQFDSPASDPSKWIIIGPPCCLDELTWDAVTLSFDSGGTTFDATID